MKNILNEQFKKKSIVWEISKHANQLHCLFLKIFRLLSELNLEKLFNRINKRKLVH